MARFFARTLAFAFLILAPGCASGPAIDGSDDPYLWLESVEGDKALNWVKGENAKTLGKLTKDKHYGEFNSQALKILRGKDKIPRVSIEGKHLHNFWQDKEHVRGLWRQTTLSRFKTANPQWETLLDVDALAKKENENWVFKGADCFPPKFEQCLVRLSRGGKDAVVTREYNVKTKKFVAGGFKTPEAKSDIYWRDKDHVFVSTDFGPGTMTESGYSRQVRIWKRGTDLMKAPLLLEVGVKDMVAQGNVLRHGKQELQVLERRIGFYSSQLWSLDDQGQKTLLPKQDSAEVVGLFKNFILLQLRDSWSVAGKSFAAGSLVGLSMDSAKSGKITSGKSVQKIYEPQDKASILKVAKSKNNILINVLNTVRGEVVIVSEKGGQFSSSPNSVKSQGHIQLSSTDGDSEYFLYQSQGFLTPRSLKSYDLRTKRTQNLKSLPKKFNATGMTVSQKWATSKDGTKVPYFLIGKKEALSSGKAPTILMGYGGFEISYTPSYSSITGKLWMENGGVYALANIRGGGEFGPQWHQSAILKNRHKAYDDFIAIGEDLISTGVTTKNHLGIYGGSNGGLLVGAVMTRRPDLFKAVVCAVPLLDMLRYSQLLAGASWMAEYGDPRDPEMRAYLASYSPYQNVKKGVKYPELFLMTSTKDDRVHPGHARKMAAKMKGMGIENIYYYENMEGGHAASANLDQKATREALRFSFFKKTLNL